MFCQVCGALQSDEEEFCHVVNTGELWEETFFEGRTPADRPRL